MLVNGQFNRNFGKYVYCLLLIFAGTYIAIRFSLWGIEEIQSNHISSSVFCFVFAVFGLLFGILSICLFQFNKNAYLKIEDTRIDAEFGWNEELHIELSEIEQVESQRKCLKLFLGDKIVWIYNLTNAKDLCEYILSRISNRSFLIDSNDAKLIFQRNKNSFFFYLTSTIVACAFVFFNIGWCVYLTEGKDLADYSNRHDVIFFAFVVAEILSVIFSFVLANKCGKKMEILNVSKQNFLSAIAQEHKNDGLDKYPNVILKKYFNHHTYRIIVFSLNDNIFAYMLERFDIKTLSWIFCYDSFKGFEILSELYDDLESSFEDVVLED